MNKIVNIRAELIGEKNSINILQKNFNYILEENGKFFLVCPKSRYFLDKNEIGAYLDEKLKHMCYILNLKSNELCSADIGPIEYNINGKNETMIRFIGSITSCCTVSNVELIVENKNGQECQIVDHQVVQEDLNPYISCISKNNEINDAFLHFYRNLSWPNLFKVYEIIDHDMGGKKEIVNKKWATDDEIDLFRCTAHNVDGAGEDARHAVREKIRPFCKDILSKNAPMELQNAKNLIKLILTEWIRYKCSK